jgi:hypothetical protein
MVLFYWASLRRYLWNFWIRRLIAFVWFAWQSSWISFFSFLFSNLKLYPAIPPILSSSLILILTLLLHCFPPNPPLTCLSLGLGLILDSEVTRCLAQTVTLEYPDHPSQLCLLVLCHHYRPLEPYLHQQLLVWIGLRLVVWLFTRIESLFLRCSLLNSVIAILASSCLAISAHALILFQIIEMTRQELFMVYQHLKLWLAPR